MFGRLTLTVLVLLAFTCTQVLSNKGLTWKALTFPSAATNWAGKWGCSHCDPYQGDTHCSHELPIFCILAYKTLPRPYYYYPSSYSSAVADKGFYNGWSGGVFGVTPKPVKGFDITSKAVGDSICSDQLGAGWQMMAHGMSWYMPNMNDNPPKVGPTWDFSQARTGGWYAWGYWTTSAHRAWTWISDQPNGNCVP